MSKKLDLDEEYRAILTQAWSSGNPQYAARFSKAMKKACAEFSGDQVPDNFSAILKAAWESDPELRAEYGAIISARMKQLWSSPAARRQQSERTKQTYDDELRKQRAADRKRNWAHPDYRAKMSAAYRKKAADPEFLEKCVASAKRSWADPAKRANRLALNAAKRAAKREGAP